MSVNTSNTVLPLQIEKAFKLEKNKAIAIHETAKTLPENTPLNVQMRFNSRTVYQAEIPCKTLVPLKVTHIYVNPENKNIYFPLLSNLPGIKSVLEVTFTNQNQKCVKKVRLNALSGKDTEISTSIADLAPGNYRVDMVIYDSENKEIFRNYEELNVPNAVPEWTNFNGGNEDVIPPPWTPIKAELNSFECWGRTYKFGQNALLNSMITQNIELLSGNAEIKIDGKNLPLKSATEKVLKSEAFYSFDGQYSDVDCKIKMRAEFDGLLYFTLDFAPKAGVKSAEIKSMQLSIPLNRKYLTSFDDNRGIMNKVDLLKETKQTIYSNLSVSPFFWIGNDDIGLMGGVPNLKNFYVKNKNQSLALNLTPETITIDLNIVDTPLLLNRSRQIEFYLQLTPVKAKNLLSRSLREGENAKVWSQYRRKFFGSLRPEHLDADQLRVFGETAEKNNLRTFLYVAPHGASPYAPDWHYWGLLWHSPYPKLGQGVVDGDDSTRDLRNKVAFTYACLDCKSFLDYKLHGLSYLINRKDFNVKNLYYDLVWPKSCENTMHGCAFIDEFGDKMTSFDIKGSREFNKRSYKMLKAKNPDAMFTYHLINTRTPADSFCDMLVQGESYDRAVAEQENYYDVLSPDLVRIAYGSRLAEQQIWLIPQFERALILFRPARAKNWLESRPETDKACRHFLGYMSVHNLGFMNGTGIRNEGKRYYQIMDFLNWNEHGTFYPYWQSGPVTKLSPASDRIMVSTYANYNKALIAVLNDTDTTQNVAIQVDTEKLLGNKKNLTVIDGFQPTDQFKLVNDQLNIQIPKRSFRLLKLE